MRYLSVINNIFSTFLSIGKIIVRSGFFLKKEDFSGKDFIVCGNGPGLEADLKAYTDLFRKARVVTVNNFLYSEYFTLIRPEYYFILDAAYFSDTGPANGVISRFLEKMQQVSWPMSLYVPWQYKRSYLVRSVKNPNIRIRYYNYVVCKGGFDSVNFLFYNLGLAFPQCQNVLNGALFMLSRNGARRLFLCGAENDWHLKFRVNEKNQVYFVDDHFYDKGGEYRLLNNNMAFLLESSSKALRTYLEVERYAQHRGTKIYNCSGYSMIDAFERLSKEEFLEKLQES